MADPTRQPAPGASGDDGRERTVDSLLVMGLDLYFAGDYERAIHAWTRVLFLDRAHARARAYIERARSVLAERQRETDELLHRGLAALDAGDTNHARLLLASAVERGGAVEAAEVALQRLGRLDVASGPDDGPVSAAEITTTARPVGAARRRWAPVLLALAAVVLLLVAVVLALRWGPFDEGAPDPRRDAGAVPRPRADTPLPVPAAADLALRRARSLFARGHLHEALAQLEAIGIDDALRPEADRLQAEVQRVLLDAVETSAPPGRAPAPAEPR